MNSPPRPRPSCPAPIAENVPAALIERPQWVAWRYELRKSKWTKVPTSVQDGREAKSTDPATWTSFAEAVAKYKRLGCDGIGFVFSPDDPFTGIDLDDCIDADAVMSAEAAALVARFNTYTEVSPSGTGAKLIVIGAKPPTAKCRKKHVEGCGEIEVYDQRRYFTITGRRWPGTPAEIADGQDQLTVLCNKHWPHTKRQPTAAAAGFAGDDDELIRKAMAAKNGDKFKALWNGDISGHGDDHSAADLAFCRHLAYWTGRDPKRIDSLFRRSGLYREKWDRTDYRERTIAKAIEGCSRTYEPTGESGTGTGASEASGKAEAEESDPDDGDGPVPLGTVDPITGRLVLSPKRTLPTARAFVREFHTHPEGRTIHTFADEIVGWRGNRYARLETGAINNHLQPWLHRSLRPVKNRRNGEIELLPFESNGATIKSAQESIRAYTHISVDTPTPSWLDGGNDRPPAAEILPCLTHNLHVPTGHILPATPQLFTPCAIDFDYDADADPPEAWMRFLEQILEDDIDSVRLLQEWFGYCLLADTSLQKILLIIGPRRSGKGTIARVLAEVVGSQNVVGPTTGSLAGTFGLQPLIGKTVAIVSDARFAGDGVAIVVERLLCISGEDTLTIDRKFLPAVTMKLPTRFVFLTNEIPTLRDASTALPGRFHTIRLENSFFGKEDPQLTRKLLAERAGILKWAVDGRRELMRRGYFLQPASGAAAIEEMEELASPVKAFVRECCTVGPGHRAEVDALYQDWCRWCQREGRNIVCTKMSFGKDLGAAVPGIKRRRGTGDITFYEGISLGHIPV